MSKKMTLEDKAMFEAMNSLWVSSITSFQSVMKVANVHIEQSNKANAVLYKLEQKYGVKRTKIEPEK